MKTAAIVLGLGVGLWVVIGITIGAVLGTALPSVALAIWPWSATASAAQATADVARGLTRADLTSARYALRRDPTNIAAIRALGLDAASHGDIGSADRWFGYGELLSRRDLAVQMWLIEQHVGRGDVTGALVHYDRALRTSREADGVLMPVLVRASHVPAVVQPLQRMIGSRPLWWRTFAARLLDNPADAGSIFPIYAALHLDTNVPDEASLLAQGIARLTQTNRYGAAYILLRQADAQQHRPAQFIRNGDFDINAETSLPPFDWSIAQGDGLSASIEPAGVGANGHMLQIDAAARSGVVAEQTIVLPAGRYRLSFISGGASPGAEPHLAITCQKAPSVSLADLPLAKSASLGSRTIFTVPSNICPLQRLTLRVPGSDDPGHSILPWIDSISLTAIPAKL